MIDRGGGGKIINIASTSGRHARARFAAYCASKAALLIFTQCLACELGPYQINVNAISPAAVDSERTGYITAAMSSEPVSPETWWTSEKREQFIKAGCNDSLGASCGRIGYCQDSGVPRFIRIRLPHGPRHQRDRWLRIGLKALNGIYMGMLPYHHMRDNPHHDCILNWIVIRNKVSYALRHLVRP
jgi:hypothetical protein